MTRTRWSGSSSPPAARTSSTTPSSEARRPRVALESSVFAQGLAPPANREAARRMADAIRSRGAEPAIAAIVRGAVSVALDGADFERFLARDGVRKVSARDLAGAIAARADGATTVAATLVLAAHAGIPVMATGGIGGVHRGAPFDESADLLELSRNPVITVCAGAKAILDLPATVERLETLGVAVIGYRTSEFPGFFTARTGIRVGSVVESAAEAVAVYRAERTLGRPGALLVVQAPPPGSALDAGEVEGAVSAALALARDKGITGSAVTPFLLEAVEKGTAGRSLAANLALLEQNAALAAEIAVTLAGNY